MATKKQRRRQLARASTQRRQVRLSQRQVRGRRVRTVAAVLVVVVLLLVLAAWITQHQDGGSSTAAPTHGAGLR